MDKQKFAKVFPLGTHLCREPMPAMAELKHDMELFKKKGFNLIKLQENWMLDEPEEGRYDFSKYEELIEYAAKLDLGIYLGLTCEQAPNWLWRKYHDARMVGRMGVPIVYQAQSTLPADGKPGPCYDHPGAMLEQLRFIKKLVTELGKYENIAVWNTWQEIGYWSEVFIDDHVCYCDYTIAAYQNWLRKQYQNDISALNSHWNVKYSCFEDIYPERSRRRNCIPQEFYFNYYMDNVNIANILSERYKAIKEADPFDRPIFAHKGFPITGAGTDWIYARTQDFFGTSNYPAWSSGHKWDDHKQTNRLDRHDALYTELWDNLAYKMDYIRSASKPGAPIWAAEYQGGPISTDFHLGRIPLASDMRRWLLTTLGAGTTAISFWVSRAEIAAPETNGFALLDSVGDTTERLDEAARIGKALNKHAVLFAKNNRPRSEAAILIDEWKYQQLSTMQFAQDTLTYDVRGWYKLLWDNNITCDFIEAAQLDDKIMREYKALIVPLPLSMSDAVAEKLAIYAKLGGNLILEAAPGRLNEAGYAVRGEMNPVLKRILKVSQKRFTMVREPSEADRWSQKERTWGEYVDACFLEGSGLLTGCRIRANMYIQTFDADESSVVLRLNEEAAGICRKYGRGRIWLLGTFIGPSGTAYRDEDTSNAVVQLLADCGVNKLHEGKLLLRKRIGLRKEAWFITNPTRETLEESFVLPGKAQAYDLLGEIVTIKDGAVLVKLEPLDVRVIIISRS